MGRGKIEMKTIENRTNRQVTFSKRRQGLLKKATELSILCDAQIGLIIFSGTNKLYTFPNNSTLGIIHHNLEQIVQNYLQKKHIQLPVHDNQQAQEEMHQEVEALKHAIETTEQKMRHYLAEDLALLHFEELHKHEQQLQSSLDAIRARKNQLMHQQLENLRRKEQMLQADNGNLYRWLMGAGQELPFYGEDQPNSSTVLQLATSSSPSPQFYPYLLQSTHPNLQTYE